ncbi:MAG: COX15/CtaA family protein, partial [Candidatus Binatia bacterium]
IPDFPLAFGGIVPPVDSFAVAIHFAHRVGALVVSAVAVATVARAFLVHHGEPELIRPALALLLLLALQIGLGASTIWTQKAVLPTTAHVAIGAAILATSVVLALRARRIRLREEVRVSPPLRDVFPQRVSA